MMPWPQFLLLLILLTSPALAGDLGQTSAEKLTRFAVIGDMPYTDTEYALLEQPGGAIAAAIKALNPPVLIHLGDFKKGRLSCTDELYKEHYRQIAYLNPHKTVYTPGDNDWTDCDRFSLGSRHDELERLQYLRQLFFYQDELRLSQDISGLVRQEGFIDNARWMIDQVIFATLHIPGTNNGRNEISRSNIQHALNEADIRDQFNEKWLDQLFQSAESAQAVVIAFHADIFIFDHTKPLCTIDDRTECDGYQLIRDLIKHKAAQLKKPILLIHGDTQAYCLHQPYHEIPNLWRLNAPGDYKYIDASQVIFDPDNKASPFTVTGLLDQKPVPVACNYDLLSLFIDSRFLTLETPSS